MLPSDQISSTLEISLTGCAFILSVLEKDVQDCLKVGKNPQAADAVKRCKIVLSKDHLQELAQQLRGQTLALNLLVSTVQRYIDGVCYSSYMEY